MNKWISEQFLSWFQTMKICLILLLSMVGTFEFKEIHHKASLFQLMSTPPQSKTKYLISIGFLLKLRSVILEVQKDLKTQAPKSWTPQPKPKHYTSMNLRIMG